MESARRPSTMRSTRFDLLHGADHRQEDFVGAGADGFLDLSRGGLVNAVDAAGDARRGAFATRRRSSIVS